MLIYTPEDLADYLHSSCYGSQNGQSAGELVEALTQRRTTNNQERRLRQVITSLRERRAYPICGTPGSGYYWAATEQELQQGLYSATERVSPATTGQSARAACLEWFAAHPRSSAPWWQVQRKYPHLGLHAIQNALYALSQEGVLDRHRSGAGAIYRLVQEVRSA